MKQIQLLSFVDEAVGSNQLYNRDLNSAFRIPHSEFRIQIYARRVFYVY